MADADTTPSGSTESFNDFKDRIIGAMTGIQAENEGHNTVVVSHSKALNVISAWDHAGMPEDNSIHMPTFEKDNVKPGGHEEFEIPKHVMVNRAEEQPSALIPLDPDVGFDQQGRPLRYSPDDVMHLHGLIDRLATGAVNTLSGKSPGEVPSTEQIESMPMIGMFGGARGAKRYGDYHKLEKAAKLEQADVHPSTIFRDTGVYRDEDGHLKYVMPSGQVNIRNAFNEESRNTFHLKNESELTLQDLYDNPELYKRYPDAKDIPLRHLPADDIHIAGMGRSQYETKETLGGWGPNDKILVQNGTMYFKQGITADELVNSVPHELQHWIQKHEGFEGGGNFAEILNNNPLHIKSIQAEQDADQKAIDTINKMAEQRGVDPSGLRKAFDFAANNIIDGNTIRDISYWHRHDDPIVYPELRPLIKWMQTSSVKRPARLSMDSTIKDSGGSVYMTHPLTNDLLRSLDAKHAALFDRETAYDQAVEHYQNISGEVEAREASEYANMSASDKIQARELGLSPRFFMQEKGWDELNRRASDLSSEEPSAMAKVKDPLLAALQKAERLTGGRPRSEYYKDIIKTYKDHPDWSPQRIADSIGMKQSTARSIVTKILKREGLQTQTSWAKTKRTNKSE